MNHTEEVVVVAVVCSEWKVVYIDVAEVEGVATDTSRCVTEVREGGFDGMGGVIGVGVRCLSGMVCVVVCSYGVE